jgi:hypothetical protein
MLYLLSHSTSPRILSFNNNKAGRGSEESIGKGVEIAALEMIKTGLTEKMTLESMLGEVKRASEQLTGGPLGRGKSKDEDSEQTCAFCV